MKPLKIFVISLASDQQRRSALCQKLDNLKLEYELFYAIDGRNGLSSEMELLVDRELALKNIGRPLTDAEFACSLSHSFIYKKMVNESIDNALILEDDAQITTDLLNFIQSKCYANFNLLLLNHLSSRVFRFSSKRIFDKFRAYRLISPCYRTCAYYLNKATANYLLHYTQPVSYTADWPGNIIEVKAHVIWPLLVQHPEETITSSTINATREYSIQTNKSKLLKTKSLTRLTKPNYWKNWLHRKLSIWLT